MKNQNSKFKIAAIALLALTITSLPFSRAHADSYLAGGVLIGALAGGLGGGLGGYFGIGEDNGSDMQVTRSGGGIILGITGAIVGGTVGGIIGSKIYKEPKVTIAPTISPSQNGGATYGLGINGRF